MSEAVLPGKVLSRQWQLRASVLLSGLLLSGLLACSSGEQAGQGLSGPGLSGPGAASSATTGQASPLGGAGGVSSGDASGRGASTPDSALAATGARVSQILSASELIGGPAAQGTIGDYLIQNSYLRAIVQNAPGLEPGPGPFGGNLVDMDLVRPVGQPGQDNIGEMAPFLNLALSARFTTIRIVDDGATSGTAILEACGSDAVYDFVDLNAVLDGVKGAAWLVPYEFNEELNLTICSRYTLGASDKSVRIDTTFTNPAIADLSIPVGDLIDSGGDVEAFMPNPTAESYGGQTYTYGGFGMQSFAPMDWLGFFGNGVSYGYLPPLATDGSVNSLQVSAAGICLSVIGTTKVIKVLHGKDRYLTSLPIGVPVTITRYLTVAPNLSGVLDNIHSIRKTSVGTVSGTVLESTTNAPLANVRITALKNSDLEAPVGQFLTDTSGKFSGTLPAGNYGLIAAQGFDFMSDGRPQLQTPESITVTAGKVTTHNMTMSRTGKISLDVLDGATQTRLPARVMFFGADSTPAIPALMDVKDDHFGTENLAKMVFLTSGTATIDIRPGTYDVVFDRGFEYDVQTIKGVVVTAGATATAKATLTRVIDTQGYLSGDLHVHGVNSPDSPVSFERRVASFAAEGVEVLVMTDHDAITDLNPTVDSLGLAPFMTSVVGEEITTFNTGHMNVFPLLYDATAPSGGALVWTEPDANCVTYPSTSNVYNNLTVPQMLEVASRCLAAGSNMVRQINHPRGSFQGYFGRIGLDLSLLGSPNEVSADPSIFRMPDGADLFDAASFDVIEIANGGEIDKAATVMNDWFGFLNRGYRKAGSAVSDTHTEVIDPGGYSRTWVKTATDSPQVAHTDAAFPDAYAKSLNEGRVVAGLGAFVTAKATSGSATGNIGELMKVTSGSVSLAVTVQSPEWSTWKRVDVFVNPVVYANTDDVAYTNFGGLGPVKTYCNSTDDDGTCRNLSTYTGSFVPTLKSVSSSNAAAKRREANLTIPLTLSQDAWVVVVVWDGSAHVYGNYGDNTMGFTNPIYLDVNGNGVFDAPCKDYVGKECPFVLAASKRPDGIASRGELRYSGITDHHLEQYMHLSDLMRMAWGPSLEVY